MTRRLRPSKVIIILVKICQNFIFYILWQILKRRRFTHFARFAYLEGALAKTKKNDRFEHPIDILNEYPTRVLSYFSFFP